MIVDDEPLARKILREHVAKLPDLKVISECSDAMQVQKYLEEESIDVLYLDINMPTISGIDFIRYVQPLPLVVFTTAYPDFAVEAFELEAFDYLVKPISFERFLKSFQRIRRHLERDEHSETGQRIKIKEGKRLYHVSTEEIYVVQAYGDYIKIYTREKVYVTKHRLLDFKVLLPDQFLQVHRSYIINLSSVKYLEGNFVMVSDHRVPVSQSYREKLMKRL